MVWCAWFVGMVNIALGKVGKLRWLEFPLAGLTSNCFVVENRMWLLCLERGLGFSLTPKLMLNNDCPDPKTDATEIFKGLRINKNTKQ